MNFLKVSDYMILNLEEVKAIERTTDGLTRFFVELDYAQTSVVSGIPFETIEQIIKSRSSKEENSFRNIEQLARYQATPIP